MTRRFWIGTFAVGSAIASGFVLSVMNEALRRRHPPGVPLGDMGQGLQADGLQGGGATATQTLQAWADYAAAEGGIAGRTIALWWLVIDIVFLAVLGYGLLAWTVRTWTAPRYRFESSPGVPLLHIAATFALVLVGVDIVENAMAAVVILADGGGPAGLLRWWGRLKWALAGGAALGAVAGGLLFVVERRRATPTPLPTPR